MISELKPIEKILKLIDECLINGTLDTVQVSKKLDCSERHARRMMKHLASMNHELFFINAKYIRGGVHNRSKLEVSLND